MGCPLVSDQVKRHGSALQDLDVSIFDPLLYRGKARDVAMVIIDGEVVMRDGQSTAALEAE